MLRYRRILPIWGTGGVRCLVWRRGQVFSHRIDLCLHPPSQDLRLPHWMRCWSRKRFWTTLVIKRSKVKADKILPRHRIANVLILICKIYNGFYKYCYLILCIKRLKSIFSLHKRIRNTCLIVNPVFFILYILYAYINKYLDEIKPRVLL